MAKKNKKAQKLHDAHHQAMHEYIVRQIEASEVGPAHQHVIPVSQGWHLPNPMCWCHPLKINEDPRNGMTTWAHPKIVH